MTPDASSPEGLSPTNTLPLSKRLLVSAALEGLTRACIAPAAPVLLRDSLFVSQLELPPPRRLARHSVMALQQPAGAAGGQAATAQLLLGWLRRQMGAEPRLPAALAAAIDRVDWTDPDRQLSQRDCSAVGWIQ